MNLSPSSEDITVTKGDTVSFTLTLTDASGSAVNLTGMTVYLTVDARKAPTDDHSKMLEMIGTVTNAAGGVVRFDLSDVDSNQAPGTYFYDVEIHDGAMHTRTLLRGKWIIESDITNAEAPPTVSHVH